MRDRLAVVLFNLGGPDSLDAVRPFLFNLFNDRAIIGVPQPLRYLLAQLIALRRAKVAREIYAQIGGASPLLQQTRDQARALQRTLEQRGHNARCFTCMRYWHPRSREVAAEVRTFAPKRIVLLPLYPQYSSTTTGSSAADWHLAASRAGIKAPTRLVCCFPAQPGFVQAVTEAIRETLVVSAPPRPMRLLFSAHGLPKRVIEGGDPYRWQVERTVSAVLAALGDPPPDHVLCYQSRVGPLEWIGPSTEAELRRAAREGVAAVVVPIAFVSEHSETLVELDIDYRNKALQWGIPGYVRVPTVGVADAFIGGLASLVERALTDPSPVAPDGGGRLCPAGLRRCPAGALSVGKG